jgi:hypothetical protein
MKILKAVFARLRRLGFRKLILLAAGLAVFLLAFFMVSLEALHYSESTQFCSSCHGVMDAEIATHKISPHANTDCGTCHIGPGAIPRMLDKVYGARYLFILPLDLYERPLETPLRTLRPAREICEQCHWPDKFYPVRVVTENHYDTDRENTLRRVVLPLKTGSGEKDLLDGRGLGIHWHIQNPVHYIATDDHRQEIPWIQAEIDGEIVTYVSIDAELSPEDIDSAEKREMDCLDCHNRVTHDVARPSDALDEAMAEGLIPDDLDYIKQQGVAVLETRYEDHDQALLAIDGVIDYYREELPDVYAERSGDIQQAVEQFKTIYDRTHFPFMSVYWDTYPDDVGHKNDPGCLRCHDGKHLNSDGEAIRATCSLCHGVPLVGAPGEPLPKVDLEMKVEPESHQNTLWLAEHRFAFNETCSECHTTTNPAGSDDSSFCSNSACHGSGWEFLAIDNPAVIEMVAPPHLAVELPGLAEPPVVPHLLSEDMVCANCHGPGHVVPFPENHVEFPQEICTVCHASSLSDEAEPMSPPPEMPPPPPIPHPLANLEACVQCHGIETNLSFPENHTGFTEGQCTDCHWVAEVVQPPPEDVATAPETTPVSSVSPTDARTGVEIPPAIPHALALGLDCLRCHAPTDAAFAVPPDHVGRSNDTCQVCHLLGT